MVDFRATTLEDFLSKEELEKILYFAKNTTIWAGSSHSFWSDRIIDLEAVYECDPELGKMLDKIKDRTLKATKVYYDIDQDIYSDLFNIVRWFPEMEQPPHSDDMKDTEHHNANAHRSFGVVIYLNDDFSGGETFYPQHEISIKPKSGMLAIHPADQDHMHGVTKILGNTRYTLTTFITFDETKRMKAQKIKL